MIPYLSINAYYGNYLCVCVSYLYNERTRTTNYIRRQSPVRDPTPQSREGSRTLAEAVQASRKHRPGVEVG